MKKAAALSILVTVLLLAVAVIAQAQQAGKVYRVGRLSGGLSSSSFSIDALRRELREIGLTIPPEVLARANRVIK